VIVGRVVGTGAPRGATTSVAFEAALALPSLLVAVTRTRIVEPTSAAARVYVFVVAPAITAQFEASPEPPSFGQRRH
jgi:RecB family exonuclease